MREGVSVVDINHWNISRHYKTYHKTHHGGGSWFSGEKYLLQTPSTVLQFVFRFHHNIIMMETEYTGYVSCAIPF